MNIVCCDLEGVFVPEIWINVAKKTGIDELRLTTRDISDYDVLMKKRLAILADHGLKLADIADVIATIDPLEGALEFLTWLRKQTQVIIVSDTFTQFAGPLMEKLLLPTLFCNTLTIGDDGAIVDYNLRQKDGKRQTVLALRTLNYHITAMGDSYNDTGMLAEADLGILFRPPENVVREFPQFPVATDYDTVRELLADSLAK
ncbi:bifunctional phosphoserine phosphatase/homoserine phosphotransferase ThrH [Desulfosudis oleivorans]|uniref:phosphoserine phosphatase n=1 Tax=Desulfosudis oleivorans (strain DSM 6200 / JCM 39069 / Hxd3) TaxID=96561 RepID=A8ZS82_DESOH|nr:bifunctional phosphoserine phosphatase/homoserine phosphotransferase ThrH [Desulfosudis oleivorans]ABW66100.1 phosphoserine phosphatase/homoserine phosphotransferase bifunctional protein [Desulfosudis oleivorans Hxd3]